MEYPTLSGRLVVYDSKRKIMKTIKLTALLVALLLVSLSSNAQLSFGVEGGYTKSKQHYGELELPENANTSVNGFNVSGLLYYNFGKYFRVGVEPGIAKRGAACEPGWQPVFEGDTKLHTTYFELPLMVSGGLPLLNDKIEVYGKLGYGQSTIIAGNREIIDFNSDDPPTRTRIAVGKTEQARKWDHGLYGSLGVGYNIGKHQIFLESDYYFGLKDFDRLNTSKNRSNNFLNFGYMFRL